MDSIVLILGVGASVVVSFGGGFGYGPDFLNPRNVFEDEKRVYLSVCWIKDPIWRLSSSFANMNAAGPEVVEGRPNFKWKLLEPSFCGKATWASVKPSYNRAVAWVVNWEVTWRFCKRSETPLKRPPSVCFFLSKCSSYLEYLSDTGISDRILQVIIIKSFDRLLGGGSRNCCS